MPRIVGEDIPWVGGLSGFYLESGVRTKGGGSDENLVAKCEKYASLVTVVDELQCCKEHILYWPTLPFHLH